jgi:competence protein ComEA
VPVLTGGYRDVAVNKQGDNSMKCGIKALLITLAIATTGMSARAGGDARRQNTGYAEQVRRGSAGAGANQSDRCR